MSLEKELLIVGGGFAGFWSAVSAIRQSREINKRDMINITLINPDNAVTILPTQNDLSLEGLSFDLDRYLVPLGVTQIMGRVTAIFPEANNLLVEIDEKAELLNYDYLILATGASLVLPEIAGIDNCFRVDSIMNILKLEKHFIKLAKKDYLDNGALTIVIVGSESIGLEAAVQIEHMASAYQRLYGYGKRKFKVVMIEEEGQIAPKFPIPCREYIESVIALKNIEVIVHNTLKSINADFAVLASGEIISTKTVIWTIGMQASNLTHYFVGQRDTLNRIGVDSYLKLSHYSNVIAAGNVSHFNREGSDNFFTDCQYAQFEGRWAGHNAINDLFNLPLKSYEIAEGQPCVDLGPPALLSGTTSSIDTRNKRFEQLALEKYLNETALFPWQDIEATVKASYPEFIIKN